MKRKVEGPKCDKCQDFLYLPVIHESQALCEYCSFGCEATYFPQSMFDWLQENFPEEWKSKKARFTEEMMKRLPPNLRICLQGIPEADTKEALMRAFIQDRTLDLQVALYDKEELPIKSYFRTILQKAKEPPFDIEDCMGYLSLLGDDGIWYTLVLVDKISVTVVAALPLFN
jgi:hypothetical protein